MFPVELLGDVGEVEGVRQHRSLPSHDPFLEHVHAALSSSLPARVGGTTSYGTVTRAPVTSLSGLSSSIHRGVVVTNIHKTL